MSKEEHLDKIASRCRLNIAHLEEWTLDDHEQQAIAGWRATISAIEGLRDMGEHDAEILASNIIAAWPAELL